MASRSSCISKTAVFANVHNYPWSLTDLDLLTTTDWWEPHFLSSPCKLSALKTSVCISSSCKLINTSCVLPFGSGFNLQYWVFLLHLFAWAFLQRAKTSPPVQQIITNLGTSRCLMCSLQRVSKMKLYQQYAACSAFVITGHRWRAFGMASGFRWCVRSIHPLVVSWYVLPSIIGRCRNSQDTLDHIGIWVTHHQPP